MGSILHIIMEKGYYVQPYAQSNEFRYFRNITVWAVLINSNNDRK